LLIPQLSLLNRQKERGGTHGINMSRCISSC